VCGAANSDAACDVAIDGQQPGAVSCAHASLSQCLLRDVAAGQLRRANSQRPRRTKIRTCREHDVDLQSAPQHLERVAVFVRQVRHRFVNQPVG